MFPFPAELVSVAHGVGHRTSSALFSLAPTPAHDSLTLHYGQNLTLTCHGAYHYAYHTVHSHLPTDTSDSTHLDPTKVPMLMNIGVPTNDALDLTSVLGGMHICCAQQLAYTGTASQLILYNSTFEM